MRFFRSNRIWLCDPHGMKIGFGFVLTGILFGFFAFLIGNHFSPGGLIIVCSVLAAVVISGVLMMIWCKLNDLENIHSFALTDEGDLYHIRIAIPEKVIPVPRGEYDKEHVHQKVKFSDVARLSCEKSFESSVCEVLLNKDKNLGWRPNDDTYSVSAYIIKKMEYPATQKITIEGATIRYLMEGRDIFFEAKLYRHNKGYKTILNHIQNNLKYFRRNGE